LQQENSTASRLALVIGAGLGGACSAYALAQNGWQVQVIDAAALPAQGASALPVGLMAAPKSGGKSSGKTAPTHTPDWDGAGMACTLRWLEAFSALGLLQPGQDWQRCGTAHNTLWAKNPAAQTAADTDSDSPSSPWLWQDDACWVKPQRLVAACLAHPAIACAWQAHITQLIPPSGAQGLWQVQAADGRAWQASAVVLAASVGSLALLQGLPLGAVRSVLWRLQTKQILRAVAGQAIYAPWQRAWNALLPMAAQTQGAPHACNGHGHFLPAIPEADGAFWLSGASYVEDTDAQAANTKAGQLENQQRLAELLPTFAPILAQQVQQGQIRRFIGLRCTTPTRLPELAQPLPGLWLQTGFGSRGLSHAPLAAEFLAAQLLRIKADR